jgi:hypothetical protein
MSIDLHTRIDHPIQLGPMLGRIGIVLQAMLGTAVSPLLSLAELRQGAVVQPATDDLRDRSSAFFLISLCGEPEAVGVTSDGEFVAVIMGAQRTKLEYALGAAVAVAFAREFGVGIEDDSLFYSPEPEIDAERFLIRLRKQVRPESYIDIRRASEDLTFAASETGGDRKS